MTKKLRMAGFLVALMVLLSSCSRLEFAYEYGDWFAARRVASYLDLDRAQRHDFRSGLQAYRDFHRVERLPELVSLLEDLEALLADPAPGRDDVAASVYVGEAVLAGAVADLIPLAATTLSGLSPAQIAHLEQQLADGRRAFAEDVAPDRGDRLQERVERWTGPLSDAQTEQLRACHARAPDVTSEWLDWRAEQDGQLVGLLREQSHPEPIAEFLHAWWLDANARPEPLRQARARTREVWLDCAPALLASLSDEQRRSAHSSLSGYREDFLSLAAR